MIVVVVCVETKYEFRIDTDFSQIEATPDFKQSDMVDTDVGNKMGGLSYITIA